MLSSPRISIITPVKGRTDLFKQTYESVMWQNNPDWEWIIIDDGSTERDFCEIEKMCKSADRVLYIKRDNNGCGASYCRNIGANKANGEWLVFLDADDMLSKVYVENRINDIKSNPDLDFIAYRALVFREHIYDTDILWNDFTDENDLDRFLKVDTPWQTTGVLWNKKFFDRVGGFDAKCKNWQDWEIHVRALALNPKYIKIKRNIDFFYRKSDLSDISTRNLSKEFLLDRIKTIDRIVPLLMQHGQLSSYRSYYLSKLLFSTGNLLQVLYCASNVGISVIEKYALIGHKELSLWRWYIRKGYNDFNRLSFINRIIKKMVDKFIYLYRHDHFIETKTNFLKTRFRS